MRFFDAWSFRGKSHGPALKSWTLWDDPPTIQVLQNEHDFLAQDLGADLSIVSKQTPVLLLEKIVGEIGIFSPFFFRNFLIKKVL